MSFSTFNLAANNVLNNGNGLQQLNYNPITNPDPSGINKTYRPNKRHHLQPASNFSLMGDNKGVFDQRQQQKDEKSLEQKKYGDALRQQMAQREQQKRNLKNNLSQSYGSAGNSSLLKTEQYTGNANAYSSNLHVSSDKLPNFGYGTFPSLQNELQLFPPLSQLNFQTSSQQDNSFITRQQLIQQSNNRSEKGFTVPNQFSDNNGFSFQSGLQNIISKPLEPLNFSKAVTTNASPLTNQLKSNMSKPISTSVLSQSNFNTGFNPRLLGNPTSYEPQIPQNVKIRGRLQRENDLQDFNQIKLRKQQQLKEALQQQIEYKQKMSEIEKKQRQIEEEVYQDRYNLQKTQGSQERSQGRAQEQKIESLQHQIRNQQRGLQFEMRRVNENKQNLIVANNQNHKQYSPQRSQSVKARLINLQSNQFQSDNSSMNSPFDRLYNQRIQNNQQSVSTAYPISNSGREGVKDYELSSKRSEIDLMRDYYSFQQQQFEKQMNLLKRDMFSVADSQNQVFNEMLLLRDKVMYNNVMNKAYPDQIFKDQYYSVVSNKQLHQYINDPGQVNYNQRKQESDKIHNGEKQQQIYSSDPYVRQFYQQKDNDRPLNHKSEMVVPEGHNRFIADTYSGDVDETRQTLATQDQMRESMVNQAKQLLEVKKNPNNLSARDNSELAHDTRFQPFENNSQLVSDVRSRSQKDFFPRSSRNDDLNERAEVPAAPDLNDVYGRPHSSNETRIFRKSQIQFQKVQQEHLQISQVSNDKGNSSLNKGQSVFYNQHFNKQIDNQLQDSAVKDPIDNNIQQIMGSIDQLMENLENRANYMLDEERQRGAGAMRRSDIPSLKLSAINNNQSQVNSTQQQDQSNFLINESFNKDSTVLDQSAEYPYKRISVQDELDQVYLKQAIQNDRKVDKENKMALGLKVPDTERNSMMDDSQVFNNSAIMEQQQKEIENEQTKQKEGTQNTSALQNEQEPDQIINSNPSVNEKRNPLENEQSNLEKPIQEENDKQADEPLENLGNKDATVKTEPQEDLKQININEIQDKESENLKVEEEKDKGKIQDPPLVQDKEQISNPVNKEENVEEEDQNAKKDQGTKADQIDKPEETGVVETKNQLNQKIEDSNQEQEIEIDQKEQAKDLQRDKIQSQNENQKNLNQSNLNQIKELSEEVSRKNEIIAIQKIDQSKQAETFDESVDKIEDLLSNFQTQRLKK